MTVDVPHGYDISIHSLRGEGDEIKSCQGVCIRSISIHSLRGEGDSAVILIMVVITAFQSTPSVGRETLDMDINVRK